MKIVFDVEKRDETTGKTYYPGTEYEMSEEKAAKILAQTKYVHLVVDGPIIVSKVEELTEEEIKNLKDDEVIEVETSEVIFEEVEKPKKKKKEIKKD